MAFKCLFRMTIYFEFKKNKASVNNTQTKKTIIQFFHSVGFSLPDFSTRKGEKSGVYITELENNWKVRQTKVAVCTNPKLIETKPVYIVAGVREMLPNYFPIPGSYSNYWINGNPLIVQTFQFKSGHTWALIVLHDTMQARQTLVNWI